MQPDYVVIADLIRERDEARAQIFAAHAERNEADRDLDVARAEVRSLTERVEVGAMALRLATAERDALLASPTGIGRFIQSAAKANAEANDLRARLSRAREALGDFDEEQPHYRDGKEAEDNWRARQEAALAALRAALAEPPAG